ncbi:PTS fructose transporter subunit IIABC [Lactococcus garvieae]|uniref:PTS fructose transporter subunit IIABC n=1 Tax=Lactococcus garvieae TaxID=1363 RepID=UPI003854F409
MDLSHATQKELIFLDKSFSTREEIFDFVSKKFEEQGIVSSSTDYKQALYDREQIGVTGFENGLAIPHGKSSSVNRAAFAVVRLTSPLLQSEYPSLDMANKVELLFVLAVPESQGGTHLDILAHLAGKLGDVSYLQKFKAAQTADEVLDLLSEKEETELTSASSKGFILGVTACAAGVAHTYMAAEAISKKATALGYAVKVEKQGANGIEDEISMAEVNQAVGVILAHDVALKNTDRFEKLPKLDVPVAAPIKNADKLVKDLINKSQGYIPENGGTEIENTENAEKKPAWSRAVEAAKTHLMTGVSFMLPFVVAGGLILTIGLLMGGGDAKSGFAYETVQTGVLIFNLMLPVLAGYISYSIADKPGIVVGMSGGIIASTVGAGYLGAILAGFVAGWLVNQIKKIPLPSYLAQLKPIIFIPLFGSGIIALFMYIVGIPLHALNDLMTNSLQAMQGSNLVLMGVIIGAMMAVDMGGPINKAAFAFCVGMLGDKIYAPMAACWIGIMLPPVAMAVATMIAPHKFTQAERGSRFSAIIGGLTGITEFAIPFAVADPWRVILSCVVGSAVGGGMALGLGVTASIPSGGIFVVPFFHNPIIFVLSFVVGVFVTAVMVVGLKKKVVEA